jgi:cell division protein FtsI (penicillin-binding protein 3)
MHIFAMDLPMFSLAVDPVQVTDPVQAAGFLTQNLGGDFNHYLELMDTRRKTRFVRVYSDLSNSQRDMIFQSDIPGFIPVKERKRVRPFADSGLPILGMVNRDHHGVGGVEQGWDSILRGEDGWAIYQRDAYNRNFSSLDYPVKPPRDGHHVVSTLDHVLQTIIEEALAEGVRQHAAKAGCAVLMDPFTGEILAMSSVQNALAAGRTLSPEKRVQNRCLQLAFEPGSTFKIVTVAAALEEGMFKAGSRFFCENGSYRISAGHTIHDHHKQYSWLTLSQVLEYSSNIGTAKLGQKLGRKILYKYARDFGFGNKTRLGLPGETGGMLPPAYQWNDFSTAMIAFGQGVSVSALQLCGMISAVANGGELVQPRIVRSVLDQEGEVLKTCHPQIIRRVISESTAAELRRMLEKVVTQGTGELARVEGIRIAGKTGTAQMSAEGVKGYLPGAYVSSFAGFWPAESPMYALVIVLDEPAHDYYGSQSAAPIFARIVKRMAGLPLERSRQTVPARRTETGKPVFFSSLNTVQEDEYPSEPGTQADSPYHIPAMIGLSMRDALRKLGVREVEARVEGSGVVFEQDPLPGKKIEKGMICRLKCR